MVINIHITPRERERLIREERQRRRVARLLQVRQQAEENAQLIRERLRNEKKITVNKIRRELRKSISERMSEVEAEECSGPPRMPLPSVSSTTSSSVSGASSTRTTRTPRRHRRVFTKEDAIKALERGRRAHERLLAEKAAARKKAEEAIRLRREAAEEANKFNKAIPTTR